MPVTEAQVVEALRPVLDPQLEMSVVELGMVDAVQVAGDEVTVVVALPVDDYPAPGALAERVRSALGALPGVARVEVATTVMTGEARAAVRERMASLQGGGAAPTGSRLGHEEGRPNPFIRSGSKVLVLSVSS